MQRNHDHQDLHSFPTRRSSDLASLTRSSTASTEPSAPTTASTVLEMSPRAGTPHTSWSMTPSRSRSLRASTSMCVEYPPRSEEHTSELQSRLHLVCRLLLEKKK